MEVTRHRRGRTAFVLLACLMCCSCGFGPLERDFGPARPPAARTFVPTPERAVMRVDQTWVGVGPSVVILGDSLTVMGSNALIRAMPDRSIKISSYFGEGFSGGDFSTEFKTRNIILTDAESIVAKDRPLVIVIALGTNDAWKRAGSQIAALETLDLMVGLFPTSCRVTVAIPDDVPAQPTYDPVTAKVLNDRLRAVGHVVVDWNEEIQAEPTLVSGDGIHLSQTGIVRRAEMVAAAVDVCLHRSPSD